MGSYFWLLEGGGESLMVSEDSIIWGKIIYIGFISVVCFVMGWFGRRRWVYRFKVGLSICGVKLEVIEYNLG